MRTRAVPAPSGRTMRKIRRVDQTGVSFESFLSRKVSLTADVPPMARAQPCAERLSRFPAASKRYSHEDGSSAWLSGAEDQRIGDALIQALQQCSSGSRILIDLELSVRGGGGSAKGFHPSAPGWTRFTTTPDCGLLVVRLTTERQPRRVVVWQREAKGISCD